MNSESSRTEPNFKTQALQALEDFNEEEILRQQEKVSKEQKKKK